MYRRYPGGGVITKRIMEMVVNASKLEVLDLDLYGSTMTVKDLQALYKLESLKDLTVKHFGSVNIDDLLIGLGNAATTASKTTTGCRDLSKLTLLGELPF